MSDERNAVRCAVYTRKSTDEGLEQDFNSLDAQRLAGENFIASQAGEGWTCLPERYDDGGYTGGNTDRPALQRLLDDVKAGNIDCVVVYKVDRLSRSLLDFARIMGVFEEHGVAFVSVTQSFNSANSMGRLTLNILLSFAQFEREVISERTRDKISMARKKGKWSGGCQVLGYDVAPEGGRIVINDAEAEQVRSIYALYLERGGLLSVIEELDRRGWTNKTWVTRAGKLHRGKPFTKNVLHGLLTNPIYIGKVRHHGKVYEGEHEAIVEEETFGCVQRKLARQGPGVNNRGRRFRGQGILQGILRCKTCDCGMRAGAGVTARARHCPPKTSSGSWSTKSAPSEKTPNWCARWWPKPAASVTARLPSWRSADAFSRRRRPTAIAGPRRLQQSPMTRRRSRAWPPFRSGSRCSPAKPGMSTPSWPNSAPRPSTRRTSRRPAACSIRCGTRCRTGNSTASCSCSSSASNMTRRAKPLPSPFIPPAFAP
jgi:DNA invertase Pin-like site-specific DNA recombinase